MFDMNRKTLLIMANPRHSLHVAFVVIGVAVGAVLSFLTGDATAPMISGGVMSAIGYWAGAAAHRKHG
jgi:hypothetical protein